MERACLYVTIGLLVVIFGASCITSTADSQATVVSNDSDNLTSPSEGAEHREGGFHHAQVSSSTASCSTSSGAVKKIYCSYIERYDSDYFRSHIKLPDANSVSLELRRSVLDDFPSTIFQNVNISSLTVHDSVLSLFPIDSFLSIKPHLTYLDLSFNNIEELVPNQLSSMQFKSNLMTLNMSSNRLQSLQADVFRWFPELKTLVLSQNLLVTITSHTFTSGLVHLNYLDLSQNLIESLEDEAFYSVYSLQAVDLSHNAINSIRKSSFKGLTRLGILNLDWNGLVTLEAQTFTTEEFPQLNMLTIEGNRLNCSCSLEWFKIFLKANNVPNLGYATCLHPRFALFSDIVFCPV